MQAMHRPLRPRRALLLAMALCVGAAPRAASAGAAPSLALDAVSYTVANGPAEAGDVLTPAAPPAPGPLSPPVVSLTRAALGLVAGDVLLSLSFGRDALPSGTLFFSVDRGASGNDDH